MERRSEPRFQVHSPAKLTPLGRPEREIDCVLADISATGMKLVVDESLSVGARLCVEFQSHLVLVEVRHSQARGSKFIVGVERIHTYPKFALSLTATKSETMRALIDDCQLGSNVGQGGAES